jgi:hypothetical protein
MLRFIWKNWWRHKERFLLLVIGAFIISVGLSYMLGLTESNKGTVIENLQKRWQAPYHIVVRPSGFRSVTEDDNMLEPNYLSEIPGGISLKQYNTIKNMPGIDVAAPVAMIGYLYYGVNFKTLNITNNGIYRVTVTYKDNNGVTTSKNESNIYFPVGWRPSISDSHETGLADFRNLIADVPVLVAGIDPDQEAKLIGLDKAMVDDGTSQYLDKNDSVSRTKGESFDRAQIPVIMNNQVYTNEETIYKIEKLDLPFTTQKDINQSVQKITSGGGEKYLNTVKGTALNTYTYSSQQVHQTFMSGLSGIDADSGKNHSKDGSTVDVDSFLTYKPSQINYSKVPSLFPDHWKFAYNIQAQKTDSPVYPYGYRKANLGDVKSRPMVTVNWKGFYDPTKLALPKDPLTELPIQTYRPPTAELVLDQNNQPVNPPKKVNATANPMGFLTQPPMMLTTLKAAEALSGEKPISAIRIKVNGVTDFSEASQKKLENMAKQIEDKTGLDAEITLGSSPQPAIVHVPKAGDTQPEIGWIQQPWVHLGASYAIFTQTRLGFSGIILAVILVAVAYVFATHLVSLLARRKEFAVLLAIGWTPGNLIKMIFYESMIIGIFVAILSWAIETFIYLQHSSVLSLWRVLIVGFLGLIIYFLGAIGPSILIRKITPYETIKTGETRVSSHRFFKAQGPLSMAYNSLLGKLNRNILSILAIAVPTMLLTLFLFITFQLKGTMFTTWLGQYVALQVGPEHYVAMIIALCISILTTAEIMWQNVSERQSELALLKAIGWRNRAVGQLIIFEGFIIGIVSGIVGLLLSLCIIFAMYHHFPLTELWFILLTGIIPVIVGILSSIWPSRKAMSLSPVRSMNGSHDV